MSFESTVEWLEGLGLGEYGDLLVQEGFTHVSQLQGMTSSQMKALGITKLGHVKRILKNIPGGSGELSAPGTPELNHRVTAGTEATVEQTREPVVIVEAEPPPPPVPDRRRHRSSPLSSSSSAGTLSPVRKLSEDREIPPKIPQRQQSLRNLRRRSRDDGGVMTSSDDVALRRRSSDVTANRRSLPPDSVRVEQYLPCDLKMRPPIVPGRRSSLSTSPPLVEVSETQQVDSPTADDTFLQPLNSHTVKDSMNSTLSTHEPCSVADTEGPEVPIESTEPRLPPSQVDAYVNVDIIRRNPSPKPSPRRAASVKQPVPAPRKKFGGSFKTPPVSAEKEPESTSLSLVFVKTDGTASEPIENGPSGTHVSSQPVSGEDTVQPVSQEESSESVSRTNIEEPVSGGYSLEPVNKEDTPEPVEKPLDPGVLYTVVSPKKSSEEEPDVVTNGSTNSPGSAVDSGAVYAEISPIQDLQEDPSVPMPVYEEVPPAPIPSQGGPPSTGPPQDSKLIEPSVDVKKSSDDNVLVTHPDSNAAPDLPQSSTDQDNEPSPVSPQGMYEFVDISRELSGTSTTTAEQSSSTSTPTRNPPVSTHYVCTLCAC